MRDEGTTVILSTHNMASVEELCDNIALINKSNLVVTGGVEQIRREHGRNQVEVLYRPSDASVELPDHPVLTLAFDVEHKDIRRAVYDVAKGTPSAQNTPRNWPAAASTWCPTARADTEHERYFHPISKRGGQVIWTSRR